MLVQGGRRYYREFEQSKFDGIHKYNDDETHKLAKELEIPDFFLEASMANTVDEDKESMDFPKQKLDSYADNLYIKIYK